MHVLPRSIVICVLVLGARSAPLWTEAPARETVFTGGGDFFGGAVAWGAPGGREIFVSRDGASAVDWLVRANLTAAAPWLPAPTPTLTPPAGVCDGVSRCSFGSALAMSENATVLAIGASGSATKGSVVVMLRYTVAPGRALSVAQVINCPTTSSAYASFGAAVALSADARVLVVGAPDDEYFHGRVYVYVYASQGRWSHTATVSMPAGQASGTDGFGSALALLPDASLLVVGAPGWQQHFGCAYAYTHVITSAPVLVNNVTAPPGAKPAFGSSIATAALPDSAVMVVVGAPGVYFYFSNGSAHVFTPAMDSLAAPWPVVAFLSLGLDVPDTFGRAVAAHVDPRTGHRCALVGAPGANSENGGAYAYCSSSIGTQFSLAQTMLPTQNAPGGDSYGAVLALWHNATANATNAPPGSGALTALLAVGAPSWGSYRGAVGTYEWAADEV